MGSGTGIGRVRGLGSAKEGSHHWIGQRLTALGNFVLLVWLVLSLLSLPNHAHETMAVWLGSPLVAVPMILMLVSVFWHLRLGLQVVIEDYVHEQAFRIAALVLLNFYAIGAAAFGIFVVAKLAFAGAPV